MMNIVAYVVIVVVVIAPPPVKQDTDNEGPFFNPKGKVYNEESWIMFLCLLCLLLMRMSKEQSRYFRRRKGGR